MDLQSSTWRGTEKRKKISWDMTEGKEPSLSLSLSLSPDFGFVILFNLLAPILYAFLLKYRVQRARFTMGVRYPEFKVS